MIKRSISTLIALALFMGVGSSAFAEETVTPLAATTTSATEITQQMIKDKTALCAAMTDRVAKKACMKERNQLKKDFQKQEKLKREKAREAAKLKREEEKKLREAAREAAKKLREEERKKKEEARKLDTDKDGVPDLRDAFPNDPKEWKDSDKDGIGNNAEKAARQADRVALDAKALECGKLVAGADKDKCLADLAVLKKAFVDTYGTKSDRNEDSNFGQR
jgi:hypothetical protein